MPLRKHYTPLEVIAGYPVRPGICTINGATPLGDAVNFTVHSAHATACSVVLFPRMSQTPLAVIPIPRSYRIGDTWSIMIFGIDIYEVEYCYRLCGPYDPSRGLLFDPKRNVLDPYVKAVTGQSVWGTRTGKEYHGRIVADHFDWGRFEQPQIPFSDLVIYEMHVRGFTMDPSSGVYHPGTFAAVIEKIPYLKELGINAVELMPVFEFDELADERIVDGRQLLNYWGYNTTCFFAPNTSYASQAEYNREGDELKMLIRTLNENGIQVFLDVVFNHTSEGNEDGPAFSFKGLDNSVYYMLTPDGHYFNFSGCGNTMNCNHPVVQQFILDCLRYWVVEYRVDGFRFDLASILDRSEDGQPMKDPPLLKMLAYDPILSGVKLIAEAWDAGGLYQVGRFPSWKRWAEWNGRYRDDMRCFLKGDAGAAWNAVQRMLGSLDIYPPDIRGKNASVNFLTCHDGFTLHDLYAYNEKHNESNGWDNTDGANDNHSWNCGAEGETQDREVRSLRMRMMKNAFTALLCSRGATMFLAGDEFANTQGGNNNAYCQDNPISWLDWTRLSAYGELHDLVRDLIAFRKAHPILRHDTPPCSFGFPCTSIHNCLPWHDAFDADTRCIGILYAGQDDSGQDDAVFVGINAYWESVPMELPGLPAGWRWEAERLL
ncbi:MAG: glycogen debranching enzyme [Oscillospiraceae bacterium]|nr:glycogen debranching enzyme [Oscillospiraceae bacterium]